MLLLLPLFSILSTTIVAAQSWFTDMLSWTSGWYVFLFGLMPGTPWNEIILVLVVFIMLFVAFGDIIDGFTAFSPWVAWVIAGCIAIIAALTRTVLYVAQFFIVITAWAGIFSTFISIITAFVAFLLVHLGLGKLMAWVETRQQNVVAYKGGERIKTALKQLGKTGRAYEDVGK